jgi:glycolate oxidase FAD binding subunit
MLDGVPPQDVPEAAVTLSTAGLTSPIDHAPGDLVATIPAGWTLDAANDVLRQQAQWLPLDPLTRARATIGGLVASSESGPRRHRYGTPRDLLLGVELVLADGAIVKAGGRVVKNVAGYDLGRLMCGSFGRLGVITSATFKLTPVAEDSWTAVTRSYPFDRLAAAARRLADAAITPSAIELDVPPGRLLVRFESTASAARRQAEACQALLREHELVSEMVTGAQEADVWAAYERASLQPQSTLLRAAVLPTDVERLLAGITSADVGSVCRMVRGRVADGLLTLALGGDPSAVAGAIDILRQTIRLIGGHLSLWSCDSAVAGRLADDETGGVRASLMAAVKAQFDPTGTFWSGPRVWLT